ncbi:MAG: anti-sigma factor antagonist [Nitrospirae bacterium]|nr:MAG: anti-sigma factor antagonist [Nitrospirota bacterium]
MDILRQDKTTVLYPQGDLTIFEAAEFHQALLQLVNEPGALTLDLSRVNRMDTSGIQLLLAASREERVHIVNAPPSVRSLMETLGCVAVLRGRTESIRP